MFASGYININIGIYIYIYIYIIKKPKYFSNNVNSFKKNWVIKIMHVHKSIFYINISTYINIYIYRPLENLIFQPIYNFLLLFFLREHK